MDLSLAWGVKQTCFWNEVGLKRTSAFPLEGLWHMLYILILHTKTALIAHMHLMGCQSRHIESFLRASQHFKVPVHFESLNRQSYTILQMYHLFNVLVLQLLKTSSKQDSTSCTPLVGPRTRRRTRCGHQDLALQAGPIAWCWLHFLLSTCLYMFVFNCTRSWAHQHWWSCQNYQEAKAKALWETSSSHGMHGYRRV